MLYYSFATVIRLGIIEMKLTSTLLILSTLFACALHRDPQSNPDFPVNTNKVMRIFTRNGFAHACPCDGVIWSAGHVVGDKSNSWRLQDYTWADYLGNSGILLGRRTLPTRDLGMFSVSSGNPKYYSAALELPNHGDKVYWIEYDLSGTDDMFAIRRRSAEVTRLVADHIIFDAAPTLGASGTCLFNREEEVVGVIVWGIANRSYHIGIGVTLPPK